LHHPEEVCFENVDRQVPIIHIRGRRLSCLQMNATGSERVVDTHHDGVHPTKGLPILPSSPPLPPSQSKRNSDPNTPRRDGISSPSRSESSAPCNIPLNPVDDGVSQPGQPQRRIRRPRWVKSLGLAGALIWFVSFAMAFKFGLKICRPRSHIQRNSTCIAGGPMPLPGRLPMVSASSPSSSTSSSGNILGGGSLAILVLKAER
jgi:hypothetical protein